MSGAALLLFSECPQRGSAIFFETGWIVWQPRRPNLPSFFIPLCAFVAMTFASLLVSPDPAIGWAIRKTILFGMALLSATFVTTMWRARSSHAILLSVATITSAVGLVQFAIKYVRFASTKQLADDPMILNRITGFMGHWLTFSGEQLLIWCAAIPAAVALGRGSFVAAITCVDEALIPKVLRGGSGRARRLL